MLASHGYHPATLDRDRNQRIGIAIVDEYDDKNIEVNKWVPKQSHGDIVSQLATAGLPADKIETIHYNAKNPPARPGMAQSELAEQSIQALVSQLTKVRADVRAGKVDIVNLSLGIVLNTDKLSRQLDIRNLDLNNWQHRERIYKNLLAQEKQVLKLLQDIQEAGATVVVAAGNSPGNDFNLLGLVNPIVVGTSDSNKNSTLLTDVMAPGAVTFQSVQNTAGKVIGLDFDGDPDPEIGIPPEVKTPAPARWRIPGATSTAVPRVTNALAGQMIEDLNHK